jgi:hypothetical protein
MQGTLNKFTLYISIPTLPSLLPSIFLCNHNFIEISPESKELINLEEVSKQKPT